MKTQSKGAAPAPRGEALDEKLTHLTEDIAKSASRHKVPIVVALVAIVAIIAVYRIVGYLGVQQEGRWNEQIYALFQMEPAQIRVEGPKLAAELEGTRIEPVFVAQYARWLFEAGEEGDPEKALELLTSARGKHPDSLLIELTFDELDHVQQASGTFELPPIPEPVAPVSPPVPGLGTGVVPPVGGEDLIPEPGEGTEPPGGAGTEDPPSGDSQADAAEDPPADAPPPTDSAPQPTPAPGDGGR